MGIAASVQQALAWHRRLREPHALGKEVASRVQLGMLVLFTGSRFHCAWETAITSLTIRGFQKMYRVVLPGDGTGRPT